MTGPEIDVVIEFKLDHGVEHADVGAIRVQVALELDVLVDLAADVRAQVVVHLVDRAILRLCPVGIDHQLGAQAHPEVGRDVQSTGCRHDGWGDLDGCLLRGRRRRILSARSAGETDQGQGTRRDAPMTRPSYMRVSHGFPKRFFPLSKGAISVAPVVPEEAPEDALSFVSSRCRLPRCVSASAARGAYKHSQLAGLGRARPINYFECAACAEARAIDPRHAVAPRSRSHPLSQVVPAQPPCIGERGVGAAAPAVVLPCSEESMGMPLDGQGAPSQRKPTALEQAPTPRGVTAGPRRRGRVDSALRGLGRL
jgi:hypothetical protein